MDRAEAMRRLRARLTNEPVVVSLGHPAYDLFAAGDRDLNFYTWGSMGLTSSIALGLAMARTERRVIAVDGDGSILMNLGSLATIGAASPRNLVVLVMDNELYATTGGQETFTARTADLEAAGRAMGIANARTVRDAAAFERALDETARLPGPWLVVAKVSESSPAVKPPTDCAYIRHRFMAAMGTEQNEERRTKNVEPNDGWSA
ncbi:MAG: thiamine pyrophosphate-dependent enzyme [Bacteroidales bacterium]